MNKKYIFIVLFLILFINNVNATITITSPENITYLNDNVLLNWSSSDTLLNGVYSFNGEANISVYELADFIELADSTSNFDYGTSIAVDSNGYTHISYYDSETANLTYAKYNGSWNTTILDYGGAYSSIDVDSNDDIHIFYSANGSLKHAKYNGSWNIEVVDSTESTGVYTSTKITLNDDIHVSYIDYDFDVKYAKYNGSWNIETVDSPGTLTEETSIGIDSNGYVHISYYAAVAGDLKYAKYNGSWNIETLDSTGNVGVRNSLGIDSNDNVHISYADYDTGDLKYAKYNDSWNIEVIYSTGNVGNYNSLIIDSNDDIHISHLDFGNKYLLYTMYNGTWSTEILDSTESTGYDTSITVDSNDYIHISYIDFDEDLKYFKRIKVINTTILTPLLTGTNNVTIYTTNTSNFNESQTVYFSKGGTGSINECGTLIIENSTYTLISNVSSDGTCFSVGADNITLDGAGYTINYSTTSAGNGIYSNGYNNGTIKNVNINQGSSNSVSSGVYLSNSDNNNITNINVITSGLYSNGFLFFLSDFNNVVNYSSTTLSNDANAYDIRSSNNNNITGGSTLVNTKYDYYLLNTSTTNKFINNNFTSKKYIYFFDSISWFNYNNETDTNTFLKTKYSGQQKLYRTINDWSKASIKWIDNILLTGRTGTFNLTGLYINMTYTFKAYVNFETEIQSLKSDNNGDLNFSYYYPSIALDTELNITYNPVIYTQSTTNSTHVGDTILFSAYWEAPFNLSGYIFSFDNGTGSFINDSFVNMTGVYNWSNITKIISNVTGAGIQWKIYTNDSLGNLNVTTGGYFASTNILPTQTPVTITPLPAETTDNLTCNYVYADGDGDIESSNWTRWYINGILNATTQNLSYTSTALDDNIKCSVKVSDGYENSSWVNSSELTLGDSVAPILHTQSLSATTGAVNTAFTVGINVTEANDLFYVKVEVTDPNLIATNFTMSLSANGGLEHYYIRSYTPSTVGVYTFKFYAQDGSGNDATPFDGLSNYAATTPSEGGGSSGGDGSTIIVDTCGNNICSASESASSCPQDCLLDYTISPTETKITTYPNSHRTESITIKNIGLFEKTFTITAEPNDNFRIRPFGGEFSNEFVLNIPKAFGVESGEKTIEWELDYTDINQSLGEYNYTISFNDGKNTVLHHLTATVKEQPLYVVPPVFFFYGLASLMLLFAFAPLLAPRI